jgi:hypothetical protein
MKSIVLIALLGVATGVSVHKRHHHTHRKPHSQKMVQWIDGSYHDDNDLSVADSLMQNKNKVDYPLVPLEPDFGFRFVQTSSDPIHGSLGPPNKKKVEPTPDQKLEMELRQYKPIVYENEHETVVDTANSITTAEKLVGSKMAEPYDVDKRKKAEGIFHDVPYKLHDEEDEDPETLETRRSLRVAEQMYKSRFFTNDDDRKLYEQREKNGTLRKDVKSYQEKDDHDVTLTDEEVKAKELAKK